MIPVPLVLAGNSSLNITSRGPPEVPGYRIFYTIPEAGLYWVPPALTPYRWKNHSRQSVRTLYCYIDASHCLEDRRARAERSTVFVDDCMDMAGMNSQEAGKDRNPRSHQWLQLPALWRTRKPFSSCSTWLPGILLFLTQFRKHPPDLYHVGICLWFI